MSSVARSTPTPVSAPSGVPRNVWVDIAKGLLIILVVYGHMQGGLFSAGILGDWPGWVWFYQYIYAFHMPGFILLSGLFVEHSLRVGFRAFAVEKLKTLYYPRVLWSFIYIGAFLAVNNLAKSLTNSQDTSVRVWPIFVDSDGPFWFLMTLLYLSVAYAALRTLGVPRRVLCAVCILAMLGVPTLRDHWTAPWGVEAQTRVLALMWYAGWFALGILLSPRLLSPATAASVPRRVILAVVAVLGFGLLVLDIPWTVSGAPLFSVYRAALGVAAAITFSMALAPAHRSGSFMPGSILASVLALLGRRSLEIYILSGLASVGVRVVLVHFLHVRDPIVHVSAGLLAGLVCPIVFAVVMERMGFRHAFKLSLPTRRKPEAVGGARSSR